MKFRLKEIELSKENKENIRGFEEVIDLYIDRLHKLEKLYDSYEDSDFYKKVIDMYDIYFDENYEDIVNFYSAKKGTIFTTVPCKYNGIWTHTLYNIMYYELDLETVYIPLEINSLVSSGKIVLFTSKPYIDIEYNESFEKEKSIQTIEEYDFSNLENNSDTNNDLVRDMIQSVFDKEFLKESIDNERQRLVDMLNSYKINAFYTKKSLYEQVIKVCDNKIKMLK